MNLSREELEQVLAQRNQELSALNDKLSTAQEQLMQSERLASIGQLAAGVAHEINNPIGYIFSNFNTLDTYLVSLLALLSAYEHAEDHLRTPAMVQQLQQLRSETELDFLKSDIGDLMSESREGILRVRKIVQDLKDFSRVDSNQEWQFTDLHQGIDSTLNIINNEIKYKTRLIKQYGILPQVECLPSQINQVVMNIVLNAAHAIEGPDGSITIATGVDADGERVWIDISDNGHGISAKNLARIFDPFFTTKPVGQGTGLGLSLSYGIMQKHQGQIEVFSATEATQHGTRFRMIFPILRAAVLA